MDGTADGGPGSGDGGVDGVPEGVEEAHGCGCEGSGAFVGWGVERGERGMCDVVFRVQKSCWSVVEEKEMMLKWRIRSTSSWRAVWNRIEIPGLRVSMT